MIALRDFAPQKAKAFENLPQKTEHEFYKKEYLISTKYDGNCIFIVKEKDVIEFYTSDWKPFYIKKVAEELLDNTQDFTLVGEFMFDCDGRLGDRSKSAKLTTYRTLYSKNLANNPLDEEKTNIKIFDCVMDNVTYKDRLAFIATLNLGKYVSLVNTMIATGKAAMLQSKALVDLGWEGAMVIEPNSMYQKGKRVNHAIKLKHRKTADLLCIDVEQGEGKCEGIGALVLQDSKGRIVKVGSGLDYSKDTRDGTAFIGKIIEIEYEQIMDTYIQPVFKSIRDDKATGQID